MKITFRLSNKEFIFDFSKPRVGGDKQHFLQKEEDDLNKYVEPTLTSKPVPVKGVIQKDKKAKKIQADEQKIKEEKLRKKPKYQKMIEKNYDVCRSLRGFKNMQPNQFDFFELVNQLKVIEKEKMKDMADGM